MLLEAPNRELNPEQKYTLKYETPSNNLSMLNICKRRWLKKENGKKHTLFALKIRSFIKNKSIASNQFGNPEVSHL